MLKSLSNGLATIAAMTVALTAAAAQLCNPNIPVSTPTIAFVDNGDGTVTDTRTGLNWKRCAEGQVWIDGVCAGDSDLYAWSAALQWVKAMNDAGGYANKANWRIPNSKEFHSLVEFKCIQPSINIEVFLNTLATSFWTASPYPYLSGNARTVDFSVGGTGYLSLESRLPIRLVRGGGSFDSYVAPAMLMSAVSRKLHDVLSLDLSLSLLTTSPTIEPRQGPNAEVVLTFDKAIASADVGVTEGIATPSEPTFSGNDVHISLTNVPNAQYVTISLANVLAADGGTSSAASIRIGFLAGDVNQNRAVTLSDLLGVNAALSQLATPTTLLRDVNVSGSVTLADILLVNSKLTQTLPLP